MSGQGAPKGINVARLSWLGAHGGPKSRFNKEADGTWTATPSSGPASEADISRGATPEAAAAARVARLEEAGVYVPEPPADYVEKVTAE